MVAHIPPEGSYRLPAHVRKIVVSDHGVKLLVMNDPAYDTCSKQSSFVRSHRDLRIVAERVRCWGDVIENYSHDRLTLRWSS